MSDSDIDRLVVRITADASLLQQEFNKARQSTSDFGKGAGDDLKDFGDKTRDAGEEIVKLKEQILALAGAGEFKDLIEGALDYADSLTHLAQQTGFSTTMLQTLHAAGLEVGMSTDTMDQAMRSFVERLGVFAETGGGQAAAAFKALGVSTSNPIAAFDLIITKLAAIPDTANRAGLAGQVFGRDFGTAMAEMSGQGISGLQALQERLEATGGLMDSSLIQKASQTKSEIEELEFVFKQAFDEGILDGFTSEFGNFADIIKSGEFQSALKQWGEVMGQIAGYLIKIGPYLPNIAGAWAGMKAGAKLGALVPGAGETGGSEAIGAIAGGVIGAVAPEMIAGQTIDQQIAHQQQIMARNAPQVHMPQGIAKLFTDQASVFTPPEFTKAQKKLSELYDQKIAQLAQSGMQDIQTQPFGTPTGPNSPIKPPPGQENPDDRLVKNLQSQVQMQEDLNEGKQRQAAIDQALGRLSDNATAAQKAQVTKLAGQLFDEQQAAANQKIIENLNQQVQVQEDLNEGKQRQAAIDQALARLSTSATDAQKQQVTDLAGQLYDEQQEAARKKAVDDVNKSIDEQINKLHESTAALGESDEQKYVDQQILQAQNDLIRKGVTNLSDQADALGRVKEAATEAYDAQQQQSRINDVTNMEKSAYESLGNSISEAIAKGNVSFKSLLSIGLDVAQQLEEAFLKLLIINPIENSLFGGSPGYSNLPTTSDIGGSVLGKLLGGGSSGGGLFGSIFGSGSAPSIISDDPATGGIAGNLFSLAGAGGPVDPSQSYIVGDLGPEVFTPNVAGKITPNSGVSAATQGGQYQNGQQMRPQITMNVQTPDAGSFLKSKSQVTAMLSRAVAQGQRNL